MPIAALPPYLLRQDLSQASPALRFGMYLPLWGINNRTHELLWTTHDINYRVVGRERQEREFKDENKTAALKQAQRLTSSDLAITRELRDRQARFARTLAASGALLTLDALSVAPFTTGLGNEHPLENGFAFLNPYGLPYLPGSGVKGVLRQAARELAGGGWGDTGGWSDAPYCELRVGKRTIALSMLDALLGPEAGSGEADHVRGALAFWDVIPLIKGDSLMVEVMTPHQTHYYQQKAHAGSTNPHDSGAPNPISFLTVPPGSRFTFHVQCDRTFLDRVAPGLLHDERWKDLLRAAFDHAFRWLGFGAKTAVGYGAMERDPQAEKRMEEERRQARLAAMSEEERQIAALREILEAELENGTLSANSRVASERMNLLRAALEWESEELRCQAADVIEETVRRLPWSKKAKPERREQTARLRQPK